MPQFATNIRFNTSLSQFFAPAAPGSPSSSQPTKLGLGAKKTKPLRLQSLFRARLGSTLPTTPTFPLAMRAQWQIHSCARPESTAIWQGYSALFAGSLEIRVYRRIWLRPTARRQRRSSCRKSWRISGRLCRESRFLQGPSRAPTLCSAPVRVIAAYFCMDPQIPPSPPVSG